MREEYVAKETFNDHPAVVVHMTGVFTGSSPTTTYLYQHGQLWCYNTSVDGITSSFILDDTAVEHFPWSTKKFIHHLTLPNFVRYLASIAPEDDDMIIMPS